MIALGGCTFPSTLYYHVEHNVWVRREADASVTIGATSYGCALAETIVAFVAKRPGTRIERDGGLGIVELFKVVHAVHSPLSGRIAAVNEAAQANSSLITRDPYGDGWMVRLEPVDWAGESSQLVTGRAIREAFHRQMILDCFAGLDAGDDARG